MSKLDQPAIEAELKRDAEEMYECFRGMEDCAQHGFEQGARAAIALMLKRERVLREALTEAAIALERTEESAVCRDTTLALTSCPEWKNE